jgi:hypothetical protein
MKPEKRLRLFLLAVIASVLAIMLVFSFLKPYDAEEHYYRAKATLSEDHAMDDPGLPSKGITIESLLRYKTFNKEVGDTGRFKRRFFIYVVKDDPDRRETPLQMDSVFRRHNIAKTIEGARTVVFVNNYKREVGSYIGGGTAYDLHVEICLVDPTDPARRRVMEARSYPPKRTIQGIDRYGEIINRRGGREQHRRWCNTRPRASQL